MAIRISNSRLVSHLADILTAKQLEKYFMQDFAVYKMDFKNYNIMKNDFRGNLGTPQSDFQGLHPSHPMNL